MRFKTKITYKGDDYYFDNEGLCSIANNFINRISECQNMLFEIDDKLKEIYAKKDIYIHAKIGLHKSLEDFIEKHALKTHNDTESEIAEQHNQEAELNYLRSICVKNGLLDSKKEVNLINYIPGSLTAELPVQSNSMEFNAQHENKKEESLAEMQERVFAERERLRSISDPAPDPSNEEAYKAWELKRVQKELKDLKETGILGELK